ncbi:MAG: hypothetical protein DWQ34_00415 [Planctomycetota bacterium]|nr:MAG: hypothetical protein DWQ29_21185 [Planctomycetota bacterium]REJ98483.1 MAG: hypothetical protein DWQ34_00415 [Planctomycetota bacterium]REK23602.1 MAG: hypothetical protein DWQ41_16310 [Planctomycetota bacterium]REK31172.1 MAG: hypothetical protein DWQ45_20220 [Planctomycetota bacterium]
MAETIENSEVRRKADEFLRIFRSAVRKAQAKNRRLGVPNVYWLNGVRYFELPNGELSRTAPEPQRPHI